MQKRKAVRMKPGTIVYFDDWRRDYNSADRLGQVKHVTPRGGVLVTPVIECFANKEVTIKSIGRPEWLPYSKVQLATHAACNHRK